MRLFGLFTIDMIDNDTDLETQVQDATAKMIGKGLTGVKKGYKVTKAVGTGVVKGLGLGLDPANSRILALEAQVEQLLANAKK